jgi:hypothetical protein
MAALLLTRHWGSRLSPQRSRRVHGAHARTALLKSARLARQSGSRRTAHERLARTNRTAIERLSRRGRSGSRRRRHSRPGRGGSRGHTRTRRRRLLLPQSLHQVRTWRNNHSGRRLPG